MQKASSGGITLEPLPTRPLEPTYLPLPSELMREKPPDPLPDVPVWIKNYVPKPDPAEEEEQQKRKTAWEDERKKQEVLFHRDMMHFTYKEMIYEEKSRPIIDENNRRFMQWSDRTLAYQAQVKAVEQRNAAAIAAAQQQQQEQQPPADPAVQPTMEPTPTARVLNRLKSHISHSFGGILGSTSTGVCVCKVCFCSSLLLYESGCAICYALKTSRKWKHSVIRHL